MLTSVAHEARRNSTISIQMVKLARLRLAFVGIFVFSLGIAISGILRGQSTDKIRSPNFDSSRGQTGYLLKSVEHRETGIGLIVVGGSILLLALLKRK